MSDSNVTFRIKITDDGGFKKVEFDAEKLRDAIEQVKNQADKVNSELLNSNQLTQAFEHVGAAVRGLQSAMQGLTDAYSVQAAAEARLGQVMRNTMDATEADIQSIKDLASAQQELGVIGDEVQLSGAQELASYLGKKESLEKLIPVMNDMIAQQYGYNASAESAIQIASMMGKVMDGQVKALSRYGYSFTEAQEEILKFGTEEERAATLAEVIGQSVGGVNAALAATDYGKIVQANNKLGDMKERFGALVAPAMTAVNNIANVSIALSGIGKGIGIIKSLRASLAALDVQSKITAATERMLGAAGVTAAAGTTAFRLAAMALYTTLTLGLSLVITCLVRLFTELSSRTDTATRASEDFAKASEEARNKFNEETSELQGLVNTINDETAARTDQVAAIETLKDRYPELVAKYIDEKGHINDLIGLQRELNRLRAGEKLQADRDKLDEYKTKAEDYNKLLNAFNPDNPAWWSSADTTVPGQELIKNRPWHKSPEQYVKEQYEYYSNLASQQQNVVDKNKETEWKTQLKESTTEELGAMLRQYQAQTDWTGKPMFQQKIDDINAEIGSRKETKPTQNKAYWEGIRKQKQAEYNALDKSELDSEKALVIKSEIDKANANIALYDTKSGNKDTGDKENKAYKTAIETSEKKQRERTIPIEQEYDRGTITKDEYERRLSDTTIAGLEERLAIAKQYGQDETRIQQALNQARIQRKEADYNTELKQLNESLEEEKTGIAESLSERTITQEQYNLMVVKAELQNNQDRLDLAERYHKDTADIIREQQELRAKLGEAGYSTERKQLDDSLAIQKAALTRQLLEQKITQEQHDRLMLVETEKYYKARLDLAEAYGKAETGDTQAWLDARLDLHRFDKSSAEKKGNDTTSKSKSAGDAWNGVKGVADSFRDIKDAITDTDNAWDRLTKTVDAFVNMFKSSSSVIESIKNITAATKSLVLTKKSATAQTVISNTEETVSETAKATVTTAASEIITEAKRKEATLRESLTAAIVGGDTAEGAAEVANAGLTVGASQARAAAKRSEATANALNAGTGAASSVASIPFVGPILAVGAVASVIASFSSLPKFATGAVVYGPTIGLMGEYGGAKSNPEVIAPLDRLRALIGGQQGLTEVKFRIEGRELVGILNKQNNIYKRNG